VQIRDCTQRLRFEQDFAPVDDGHARAQLAHVVHDVRGQENHTLLAQFREQVQEPHTLGRVEPCRRFVHDHELGVA
jgi:hypothetical protein